MSLALPLLVAVPLVSAAALSGVGALLPRRVVQVVAVMVAAGTTALCFLVLLQSWPHDVVHWFGGWRPTDGYTLGIAFTANGLDAAMACTVSLIATAALLFAVHYYEDAGHLFPVLMLVFLGGMTGFSVTGDLFDLFVFFELMSVTAYALCGYRVEQPSVMQGSLNFAVLNSVGAFFVLMGIALVYARTGALNMAQVGAAMAGTPADGTVVVAFVLLLVGFLVKGGAIPFHFWLSDAYAVAPAPAGALFAGVMSDLGFHAFARVYWKCFSGPLGAHAASLRGALVAVGVVTAVGGAVMCFLQADTKRQLAFLVISHGGVFLAGIALLSGTGVAAATAYVAADGLLKAAVFLLLGVIVSRLGASDELLVRGRGRRRRDALLGATLAVAALGMAPLPGFGPWLSAAMLRHAAAGAGLGWLPPLLAAATAVTAGTLLRVAARAFLGWGGRSAPFLTANQPDEPAEGEDREAMPPRRRLLVSPAVLVVAGMGLAFVPGLVGHLRHLASSFVDRGGYVDLVLHGHLPPAPQHLVGLSPGAADWAYGSAATVGAVGVAAVGLWWSVLPRVVQRALARLGPLVRGLKMVHSGAVGDYALWLAGGAVVLLVAGAAALR